MFIGFIFMSLLGFTVETTLDYQECKQNNFTFRKEVISCETIKWVSTNRLNSTYFSDYDVKECEAKQFKGYLTRLHSCK